MLLSHILLAGRRYSCVVPTLRVPGLFGRAKLLCCRCPDAAGMMYSGLCRLRMAAMPSCLQWGGRMPGHVSVGPHLLSACRVEEGGVCFVFVFYRLIFLSLEIGSRDNVPPRSILTL